MWRCRPLLLNASFATTPTPILANDSLMKEMLREFIDNKRDVAGLPAFIQSKSWIPMPDIDVYRRAMAIANSISDKKKGQQVVELLFNQMRDYSIRPHSLIFIQLLKANVNRWAKFQSVLGLMEENSIPHCAQVFRLLLSAIRRRKDITAEEKYIKATEVVEQCLSHSQFQLDDASKMSYAIAKQISTGKVEDNITKYSDVPQYLSTKNRMPDDREFDPALIHELIALSMTYKNALGIMKKYNLKIDTYSVTALLHVCREEGNWKKAEEVWRESNEIGLTFRTHQWEALIECYAKESVIERALTMWTDMTADVGDECASPRAYAAIIRCCGSNDIRIAEQKFSEAADQGILAGPGAIILWNSLLDFYHSIGDDTKFKAAFSRSCSLGIVPNHRSCQIYRELPDEEEQRPPSLKKNKNTDWLKAQTAAPFEDNYWRSGKPVKNNIGFIEVS